MDHKELFAKVDYWTVRNDFWKSDANDWADIVAPMLEKGFTYEEAIDLIESIIGLMKSEYGE